MEDDKERASTEICSNNRMRLSLVKDSNIHLKNSGVFSKETNSSALAQFGVGRDSSSRGTNFRQV